MAEQSFGNTAQARAATLTSSKDRWSVNSTGGVQGLEGLYASGDGSIYTKMGGGNLAQTDASPGLNEQIKKGVNFFGYGRGGLNKGNSDGNAATEGVMNVAGQGREQAIRQGDSSTLFGRFLPRQSAMDQTNSIYGTDPLKACKASWYTKNVHGATKYGNAKMDLDGRGSSTRGRTNAESLTNGSGTQSKI